MGHSTYTGSPKFWFTSFWGKTGKPILALSFFEPTSKFRLTAFWGRTDQQILAHGSLIGSMLLQYFLMLGSYYMCGSCTVPVKLLGSVEFFGGVWNRRNVGSVLCFMCYRLTVCHCRWNAALPEWSLRMKRLRNESNTATGSGEPGGRGQFARCANVQTHCRPDGALFSLA